MRIGVDIVELEKVRQHSARKCFLEKVFTQKEIEYARRKGFIPHLATAFAAKEAVFKALGSGWTDGKEVEIVRGRNGKPSAIVRGEAKKLAGKSKVLVSMSFHRNSAIAFAVIK